MRDRYYDRKKKDLVVCLAGARSLLRPENKSSSHLSGGCAIIITTKKKSSSHLSSGCAIVITTGKKSSSHLSGGWAIVITTGKKKVLVVCLVGCAVVSVFGSGDYDRKKSSIRLSGRL